MRQDYDWALRFYYGKNVINPCIAGQLAIETRHRGEASRDIEIEAGKARKNIGKIEMINLRTLEPLKVVWSRVD